MAKTSDRAGELGELPNNPLSQIDSLIKELDETDNEMQEMQEMQELMDTMEEDDEQEDEQEDEKKQKKRDKGGCSGETQNVEAYQTSDGQCHENPKTPLYKLDIEYNTVPENWWDNLPDFDPRVYDAIAMEQAAACVDYIFQGLPDMHEVEHQIQANGFRKTCPRLKTQVPRTKVIRPKEVKCEVKIESWIKKDQTY